MTVLIATHAFTASVGLPLGAYQIVRRVKGDRRHRLVGWTLVLAMLFVATNSFAVRKLRQGQLSLLHVLSAVTLIGAVAVPQRAIPTFAVTNPSGAMTVLFAVVATAAVVVALALVFDRIAHSVGSGTTVARSGPTPLHREPRRS